MTDTTDTSTDDARPWRRPRASRKAALTAGAALTVALLGAGVAFATLGGGANPQACEKAMRSMLSQAMSGHDLSDAGKPAACRGLSDAQLQELAGRAFADSPAGALLRGLTGAWDEPAAADTSGTSGALVDQQAACAVALRPLVAKLHRMPAVAPGPCYDLHGEDYNSVARNVMTS